MVNLGDDQREIERLRAEVEKLRGLVVSRFDHDHPPTFRQGYPTHELEEVTTAEQCTWMVGEIERQRAELAALRKEADKFEDGIDWIQRALQAEAELEGFREGSEKMALKGIEMRHEIERLRAELAALREQGPVAEVRVDRDELIASFYWHSDGLRDAQKLYAAPGAQPAASVPDGWESELLDWVSACQSAYHIDNTPGHRFGGLGSKLDENRRSLVEYVRHLIAAPEAKP